MQIHFMAFIIPFFLVFIGLEFYYARKKGKGFFHFAESVANLNVGLAERITDFFTAGAFYFLYAYLYTHYAIFHIKSSWLTWILLFLVTDLIWYWYHRFAHEINLFWSAHIVHHQSEDFNYTVSTRITIFQAGIRGSFWALLPLIGFPPGMITVFLLIHGAYPFFTHTRAIGKLGFLEYIFVTPTHHGVHHARNPEYLDKNYGDILIIWDRIFGTFAAQKEKPVYGLTKPLKSYSFFWQHFHHFIELGIAVKRSGSFKKGVQIIFGRPDMIDPMIRPALERKLLKRNRSPLSRSLKHYIFFQTTVTVILMFLLLLFSASFSKAELIIAGLFLLTSLVNTGALLEKQRWILIPELIRAVLLLLFVNNYYFNIYVFTACSLLLLIVFLFGRTANKKLCGLLYNSDLFER